ncbi:hypothetical protein CSUI_010716 [Cystoisospora suis]|uniref:Transmembrane protein n=1 Tax=Cystoisospora suis TaxID=483139 RepID=A0A2C6KGG5_9APIC|nr:hypothetical protein CSUI_010716 [Cystoisospora suis]
MNTFTKVVVCGASVGVVILLVLVITLATLTSNGFKGRKGWQPDGQPCTVNWEISPLASRQRCALPLICDYEQASSTTGTCRLPGSRPAGSSCRASPYLCDRTSFCDQWSLKCERGPAGTKTIGLGQPCSISEAHKCVSGACEDVSLLEGAEQGGNAKYRRLAVDFQGNTSGQQAYSGFPRKTVCVEKNVGLGRECNLYKHCRTPCQVCVRGVCRQYPTGGNQSQLAVTQQRQVSDYAVSPPSVYPRRLAEPESHGEPDWYAAREARETEDRATSSEEPNNRGYKSGRETASPESPAIGGQQYVPPVPYPGVYPTAPRPPSPPGTLAKRLSTLFDGIATAVAPLDNRNRIDQQTMTQQTLQPVPVNAIVAPPPPGSGTVVVAPPPPVVIAPRTPSVAVQVPGPGSGLVLSPGPPSAAAPLGAVRPPVIGPVPPGSTPVVVGPNASVSTPPRIYAPQQAGVSGTPQAAVVGPAPRLPLALVANNDRPLSYPQYSSAPLEGVRRTPQAVGDNILPDMPFGASPSAGGVVVVELNNQQTTIGADNYTLQQCLDMCCAQDYYCPVPATATCLPRLREGQICRSNTSRECQRGLVCGGGRCHAELLYAFSVDSKQEKSPSVSSNFLSAKDSGVLAPARPPVGGPAESKASFDNFLAGFALEGSSVTPSGMTRSSVSGGGSGCKPWEAELPVEREAFTTKIRDGQPPRCEHISGKPCQVDRDCLVGATPFAYCETETRECTAPEFPSCLQDFELLVQESTGLRGLSEAAAPEMLVGGGTPGPTAQEVTLLLSDFLREDHSRESSARERWRKSARRLLCCMGRLDELANMVDFQSLRKGQWLAACAN